MTVLCGNQTAFGTSQLYYRPCVQGAASAAPGESTAQCSRLQEFRWDQFG